MPAEFSAHCLRCSSDCRPTSGGDRCVYPITTNGNRYGEDAELFGLAMAKADNSTVVVSVIQQTLLRHYLPHPPLLPVCLSAGWIFLSLRTVCMYALRPSGAVNSQVFLWFSCFLPRGSVYSLNVHVYIFTHSAVLYICK